MKAIVNTAPGICEYKDWELPRPTRDQVRIRTAACGICATDLKMIAGWSRTPFPAIPGHEWSGLVDAIGEGVDPSLLGKFCVAENVLADGLEVGFEHAGGYGQYFITEADRLYPLPDHFPSHVAVLTEPLAVTARGLKRLNPDNIHSAVIFGDGPIGLLMVLQLKRTGIDHVLLVGGRPKRLAVAKEFGAEAVINYHQAGADLAGAVRQVWKGKFPNVIEASGSGKALQAGLDLAAPKGKVLVLGDYDQQVAGFRWNQVLLNELELIGSNASAGGWAEAAQLLIAWRTKLEKMITQRFPADHFEAALNLIRKNPETIKVVLEW